jgi:hypothetical protein
VMAHEARSTAAAVPGWCEAGSGYGMGMLTGEDILDGAGVDADAGHHFGILSGGRTRSEAVRNCKEGFCGYVKSAYLMENAQGWVIWAIANIIEYRTILNHDLTKSTQWS